IGVIPGGTANVWATEVGVPLDPVKAALTLVNSVARPVDVGLVGVAALAGPALASGSSAVSNENTAEEKPKKRKSKARQHFLLMAGLGIDAAVMGAVSQPLKYRLGPVAVGLAAARELPKHHPFPLELRRIAGSNDEVLWSGKALQVVIGNSRLYAGVVEMTPNAVIDDGLLDVCIITAGDPLTSLQQIVSLLLRHSPNQVTAEYFQGARLALRVPASIALQVDGSAVKLKDYLSRAERQTLQEAQNLAEVMVTYRFDALPRALRLAVPHDHNAALFQQEPAESDALRNQAAARERAAPSLEQPPSAEAANAGQVAFQEIHKHPELIKALLEQGQKVKVTGASQHPEKKNTFILAGTSMSQKTGKVKPVAIVLDEETAFVRSSGEKIPPASVQLLKEGQEVVVGGQQKNKWGVIDATYVLV
ncbi:MAG TPA: diacylglycerol kinase family protein, partial [Ktedonobacterales bacterium]